MLASFLTVEAPTCSHTVKTAASPVNYIDFFKGVSTPFVKMWRYVWAHPVAVFEKHRLCGDQGKNIKICNKKWANEPRSAKCLWTVSIWTTEKVFGKKLYMPMKKSQAGGRGRRTGRKALCLLGSLHQCESSPCALIFNLARHGHSGCLISLRNIIQAEVTHGGVLLPARESLSRQHNPPSIFLCLCLEGAFLLNGIAQI